ncbi:ferredoxin [Amycolatopsis antarctica]|nr:hypothetical protein [Amycolatopsis antarctica]
MKITVDEDRCCRAGQCVLIAPEVCGRREPAEVCAGTAIELGDRR